MPAKIDLTGQVFGRLTVVRDSGQRRTGYGVIWLCSCSCGNSSLVGGAKLRNGSTRSCGCGVTDATVRRSTKHGHAKRGQKCPTYSTWLGMHERCTNENHISYKYYGAKGVKVCARWGDYERFLGDMGEKPEKGWHIDRIDPDCGYEPGNCEWVSAGENARRRNVHYWAERRAV
jgi:hypothetical protein